jgi:hypothetical protein
MKKLVCSIILGIFFSQFAVLGYSQAPKDLPENAKVELKGTLQVFIRENLKEQTADYEYFLERAQGKAPIKLIFDGTHPSQLRSGVGIAVRGLVRKGRVEVTSANIEEGGSSESTPGPVESIVLDARSAVVVIVNLSDSAHTGSELANMQDYYFGPDNSMRDIYEKITFSQLTISGQTVGPIDVSATKSQACADPFGYASGWLSQAESENPGFNRNDYRHRIFAIPKEAGCGWTGYANVGCGGSCSAFNKWSQDINTTAHEFGHNLGMAHAGTEAGQYSDLSSFMGYSLSNGVRALDAAHHWQMGWYPNFNSLSIDTVGSSGTYQIAPLKEFEPAGTAPSILRIDVANGEPYFLSARISEGYDSDLTFINSTALNGVNIHRYAGTGYDQTMRVAQLSNGQAYTDDLNNLTVTQTGRETDGRVTFTVDLGEGVCVESAPGLSISPSFATVGPDTSYEFRVDLINNGSTSCSEKTFNLNATGGSLADSSLIVAPGSQVSTLLTVSGVSNSGDIGFTVSVAGEPVSDSGTLTIDATKPVVQNLAGTYQRKGKNHRVQLSWSGSDNTGIDSYQVSREGVLRTKTTQSSYTDSLATPVESAYLYEVKAVDVYGNVGAAIVTVSTTGGDDGGGGGGNDKPCRGKKCNP